MADYNRRLLERWYLNGFLSLAGHDQLKVLMDADADAAYPYWSGGEYTGTACVWANGRRYRLEAWNAECDRAREGNHAPPER